MQVFGSDVGFSTDTADAGGLRTTLANCMLYVAVATDSASDNRVWVAGPSYTLHDLGAVEPTRSDKIMVEDRLAATAGAYGTTMDGIMFGGYRDIWTASRGVQTERGGSTAPAAPTNLRIIR